METVNIDKMTNYRCYLYLLLSVYIFVQTSFFPQILSDSLIYFFGPKLNEKSVIFSPYDHIRYNNIVVYCGLALSGTLLLKAAKLVLHNLFKDREKIKRYTDIAISLTTIPLVFLCTVAVYHLYRGEEANLFSVSREGIATLATILVCVVFDFYRKETNLMDSQKVRRTECEHEYHSAH